MGQGDERASSGKERPHSLTGHTQNNTSTAVHQLSPPGSISVVRAHLADLDSQNVFYRKGIKYSQEEARELFLAMVMALPGHGNDTGYLLQFVDSIVQFSFWGVMICLLLKKIQHMHARHTILNGFTDICAL